MTSNTKKVSFDCSIDVLERLDRLAKKGDMPRSKLISNMVEVGVDTLESSEKVGLLQISLLIRNLQESMHDWAEKMKERKSLDGLM